MMRLILAAAISFFFAPAYAEDIRLVLAGAPEGRAILTARDDYVKGLSPFDRSAKLQTDRPVSEEEFLAFAAQQVLDWNDAERTILRPILNDLAPRINALGLDWPDPVVFVHTTGREEANAAYTRANAIFLPREEFEGEKKEKLKELIAHELFHVFSRHNAKLREKLYGVIGYQPCGPVLLPAKLRDLRINNPDATQNDFCIRVSAEGKQVWVTPVLFAREPYDGNKGGTFFDYLQLKFLKVDGDGPHVPNPATYNDAKAQLFDVPQMTGFMEQMGHNTGYIIHPEETVADNFVLMLLGKTDVKSPEAVERLRVALTEAKH